MPAIVDKIADALHLSKHPKHDAPAPESAEPSSSKAPVFDHEKVTVLFVLGGPGAGQPSSLRARAAASPAARQGHSVREPRQGLWFLPPLRCVSVRPRARFRR